MESLSSLLQLTHNVRISILQMFLIMVFGVGLGFDQKYAK
jgi:hypothetical protein